MGAVLEFYKKEYKNPPRKQVDKDDGFEADGNKQYAFLESNPLPTSCFIRDVSEIRYRLKVALPDLKPDEIRLMSDLYQTFRAKGRTEFHEYLTPCLSNEDVSCLLEQLSISSYKVFSRAFEAIGTTYGSWTQFRRYNGDTFQGKPFLKINGRKGMQSTFRLNPNVALALGKEINLISHIEAKTKQLSSILVVKDRLKCAIL